ncbi:MAG TPA: serine hydrolase domain-containing protein [Longimicrobiales bacterium]|nr:serine hydrolase domain-containing protein [Longimicrobiales bacterium]
MTASRMSGVCMVVGALVPWGATWGTPLDAQGPYAGIGEILARSVADGRIAGAVAGVARDGRTEYLTAVGVQSLESGAPMTERSLFRVYSMTKAITAVAVMILHEEGRFELADPASLWLPELADVRVLQPDGSTRPPVRPITIEHLLLHTAGFSHRTSSEYREAAVRSRSIPLDQFIRNIAQVPLRFDPGEGYLYSEASTVLGRLVEVVSGMRFDEFLQARVLEPLGMTDTSFWVEPEDRARLTTVYRQTDGGGVSPYEIEELPFTERPALLEGAVGLVSTVPDFLRFGQMLAGGGELDGVRILRESTVRTMTRNGLPESILATRRGGSGWGLGNVSVVVDEAAAGSGARAGEYRWDGSAGTEFWVDPESRTVLVTMWQSAPANPDRLRQRITEIVREAPSR